ncbi:MAG: flavodoxin [Bacteroidaceae bacterium]|nr:flavodoxin [Bacteroidaceae bacterium]
MKKMTSFLAITLMALGLSSCNNKTAAPEASAEEGDPNKTLVAYFSATGTTEGFAKQIQEAAAADLYQIEPTKPYTEEDLDWRNEKSRSSVEMGTEGFREPLGGQSIDVAPYDTIYIGYPIWWDRVPTIIQTFIESQDFTGKVIIPFATSGSSTIDNSVAKLKEAYPDLNILAGKRMNDATAEDVKAFVAGK